MGRDLEAQARGIDKLVNAAGFLVGNGLFDLAVRLGERNLKSLMKSVEEGMKIVFSSPSRGMTLEKVIELPEGCRGLAGTYGYKREKYAVASEVGEEIIQQAYGE
jgi:Fe-S oxidoreductase